jgi:hypothetical protein
MGKLSCTRLSSCSGAETYFSLPGLVVGILLSPHILTPL